MVIYGDFTLLCGIARGYILESSISSTVVYNAKCSNILSARTIWPNCSFLPRPSPCWQELQELTSMNLQLSEILTAIFPTFMVYKIHPNPIKLYIKLRNLASA
jgi:hypothetical protein